MPLENRSELKKYVIKSPENRPVLQGWLTRKHARTRGTRKQQNSRSMSELEQLALGQLKTAQNSSKVLPKPGQNSKLVLPENRAHRQKNARTQKV